MAGLHRIPAGGRGGDVKGYFSAGFAFLGRYNTYTNRATIMVYKRLGHWRSLGADTEAQQ